MIPSPIAAVRGYHASLEAAQGALHGPPAPLPPGAIVLTPGNVFEVERSLARLRDPGNPAAGRGEVALSTGGTPISSLFGRSLYHAAQDTRFREFTGDFGFNSFPRTEEEMLGPFDRAKIISRARVMMRNNPYLAAVLLAYVMELGTPTLKCATASEKFNDAKETYFERWALDCEQENGFSLDEVIEIKNFEDCIAGELFIIPLKIGKLQLIASELCGSPKSGSNLVPAGTSFADGTPIPAGSRERDGIIRDSSRVVIGYRFGRRDPEKWDSVSYADADSTLMSARYVWHLFDPDRAEQGRGVPRLAPVLARFQDVFDTSHSRDQQVKNAACLSLWITKNIDPYGFAETMRGAVRGDDLKNAAELKALVEQRSKYQQVSAGAIYYGATGEDLKLIEPKLNAADFHEHYIDAMQICCACLNGMPVEIGFEGFRDSNYSSARATVNRWKRNVKRKRGRDEQKLLDPMQAWVANRASYFDALPSVSAADQMLTSWGWPAIPEIDGAKTAAQDALELANATTTRTRIYADKGLHRDLEDKVYARERMSLFRELVAVATKDNLMTAEQATAFALAQMPKVADPALLLPLVTAAVVPEPEAKPAAKKGDE